MNDAFEDIRDRFLTASEGFARRLRAVRAEQWCRPTPCAEWNVRALVNHMARGNLNYALLARGGTGAQFVRLRDVDALGEDPVGAYAASVRDCAAAFAAPGVLDRSFDYPFGTVPGRQALAVRTTDTVVHTWDLARAVGADAQLDGAQVRWIGEHLAEVYAGLDVGRFFAAEPEKPADSSADSPAGKSQDTLLRRFGRTP